MKLPPGQTFRPRLTRLWTPLTGTSKKITAISRSSLLTSTHRGGECLPASYPKRVEEYRYVRCTRTSRDQPQNRRTSAGLHYDRPGCHSPESVSLCPVPAGIRPEFDQSATRPNTSDGDGSGHRADNTTAKAARLHRAGEFPQSVTNPDFPL